MPKKQKSNITQLVCPQCWGIPDIPKLKYPMAFETSHGILHCTRCNWEGRRDQLMELLTQQQWFDKQYITETGMSAWAMMWRSTHNDIGMQGLVETGATLDAIAALAVEKGIIIKIEQTEK